jgi:hypothetical protein
VLLRCYSATRAVNYRVRIESRSGFATIPRRSFWLVAGNGLQVLTGLKVCFVRSCSCRIGRNSISSLVRSRPFAREQLAPAQRSHPSSPLRARDGL